MRRITSALSLRTSSLSCLVSFSQPPHCIADFSLQPGEQKNPPPPWYYWGGGGCGLLLLKTDECCIGSLLDVGRVFSVGHTQTPYRIRHLNLLINIKISIMSDGFGE